MDGVRPEVLEFVEETKRYVYEELMPLEDEIERTDYLPPEVIADVAKRGYFGMTIPKEYGGLGFNLLETCMVLEQIHKAPLAIGYVVDLNNGIGSLAILHGGSEELKREYLPRLARGEIIGVFAMSEPQVGSDGQGISTRAEWRDGYWVLNGVKYWITWAERGDVFTVAAATDPGKGAHGGISVFLVPKGTPGMRVARRQKMMGNAGIDESVLVFEDCKVPAENLLGELGWGFRLLMRTLDEGRVKCCLLAIGYAERAWELAMAYVKRRQAFGQRLADFQGIQWQLAEAATTIWLSRLAMYEAARKIDRGEFAAKEAAMAKLYSTEACQHVVDTAVQLFGARGYCRDYPLERIYRNYRSLRMVEGTSEIQRRIIWKQMSKLYDPERAPDERTREHAIRVERMLERALAVDRPYQDWGFRYLDEVAADD
jgi:acyl-CoA dehydrogenase